MALRPRGGALVRVLLHGSLTAARINAAAACLTIMFPAPLRAIGYPFQPSLRLLPPKILAAAKRASVLVVIAGKFVLRVVGEQLVKRQGARAMLGF